MLDFLANIKETMIFIDQNFTTGQVMIATTIIGWVFSGIVQAFPEPRESGSQFYLGVYRFMHFLANNWKLLNKQPKRD